MVSKAYSIKTTGVIKADVVELVREFFHSSVLPPQVNKTHIVLNQMLLNRLLNTAL